MAQGHGASSFAAMSSSADVSQPPPSKKPRIALSASQPGSAALSNAAQKVVEDIRKLGRIPQRSTDEDKKDENRLAKRFYDLKQNKNIPDNVLAELHLLGGAPQPAVRTRGRELIDAVKTLGYYPKETKPTGDEDKKEFQLATSIRRGREAFTPAERIEMDELKRTFVVGAPQPAVRTRGESSLTL